MGLAASVGRDNDELVDNLIKGDSVLTEYVEQIMRLVDRGRFIPNEDRANAYKDAAWRSEVANPGFLHLSAPCIYASVLENMDIKKGMTFLNIGSGTGYLTTMVGFMLGSEGISHGVELYQNVLKHAEERVDLTLQSPEFSVFDWCIPQFLLGNAFQISTEMRYDRIYIGALVPRNKRSFFCNLLKINGILIMPYGNSLQRVVRKSVTEFTTTDINAVSFSRLVPVNPQNPVVNKPVEISTPFPSSLLDICRLKIRQTVREATSEVCELNFCSYFNEKKRMERKRRNTTTSTASDSRPRRLRRRHSPDTPHLLFLAENRAPGAENREEGGENEENQGAPYLRRHPMARQIFAMFEQRVARHLEARARQAAGLVVRAQIHMENNEEADQGQPEINNEGGPQEIINREQSDAEEETDNFGFRFVSEDENDNTEIADEMADALDHFQNFEQQERTAADGAAPNRDASAEIRQNGDNNTRPTEGHHLEEQQNNEDEDEEEMHTAEEIDDSEEMVTAREWTDEEENEKAEVEAEKPPKESENFKKLKKFHEQFEKGIRELPINVQMRNYLMYQL